MRLTRLLLVFLVLGACAFAAPIGFLGIGSSGTVNATLTSIAFTPDITANGVCPLAPCNGTVNTATTLSFFGGPLTPGDGILINGGFPFGTPPPADAVLFNPFLQFANHSNLIFFFLGVDPGNSNADCSLAVATGDSCSILEGTSTSPVVLTRNGTNTLVSISIFGTATDGVSSSTWSGGFSATIPNITPLEIAQFYCGPEAFCDASEITNSKTLEVRSTSGSFFASSVPEPNTSVLLGAGLILLSLTLRRVKVI